MSDGVPRHEDGARGPAPLVLCIAGSPRRQGNSDHLLAECAAGVREAGGEPRTLVVAEAGIAPCRGCNACSLTGECVVRDGMRDVYPLLDSAGAIVVATPVYFATVPAVLKALYDRCQPYWARRYELKLPRRPRRPGGLIVAGGGGDPFGHACAVTTTRSVFAVLETDYVAEVVVEGVDSPSDVGARPADLARARTLGGELVRAVTGPSADASSDQGEHGGASSH